jgi:hypothetical protein
MACNSKHYSELLFQCILIAVMLFAFTVIANAQSVGIVTVVPQTAHSDSSVFTISGDGKLKRIMVTVLFNT